MTENPYEPRYMAAARKVAAARGQTPDEVVDSYLERVRAAGYPTRDCLTANDVQDYVEQKELRPEQEAHHHSCDYCELMIAVAQPSEMPDEVIEGVASLQETELTVVCGLISDGAVDATGGFDAWGADAAYAIGDRFVAAFLNTCTALNATTGFLGYLESNGVYSRFSVELGEVGVLSQTRAREILEANRERMNLAVWGDIVVTDGVRELCSEFEYVRRGTIPSVRSPEQLFNLQTH